MVITSPVKCQSLYPVISLVLYAFMESKCVCYAVMPLHLRISGAATDMDDARCAGIVLVHGGHMRHSASEMHLCIHTWFIKSL